MKNYNRQKLPYTIIESSTNGNTEAIYSVINHYKNYITSLSSRNVLENNGSLVYQVDEEMRNRLITKLIEKILDFEID